MTLTIVGLGPGDSEDLTRRAWRTLENAATLFLRTSRHPCVGDLPRPYESFDALYDAHERFEDVYAAIVSRVLEAARQGAVVYAVPGDPLVGESTTTRLLAAAHEAEIPVTIVNGVSFVEPSLRLLGVDALDGLQIVDGLDIAAQHHPPLNPSQPALIGQVYSRAVASDVKLTLMNQYPDELEVVLLHGAGTADAQLERLPLYAIDRSDAIDHLSSLYVPALGPYASFEAFQEIIAHLRAPEGCPWDRKQTHESLRPYLVEEAYEVLEAIDAGDWDELAAELGDLMLQIVLHTQIATEMGEFQMADVMRHINEKMIRRHPHVWGDVNVDGAQQVTVNWDAIKQREKAAKGQERASRLDGVPKGAPALMVAHQYQAKAAKVGFDWPTVAGVVDKLREEVEEIVSAEDDAQRIEEIGDVIFVLVNWLRWLGVDDPESLMRSVNAKFYRRFRYIEEAIAAQGEAIEDYTLVQMDALWDEAKLKGL